MADILVNVIRSGNALGLEDASQAETVITQWDNCHHSLLFTRPPELAEADMYLVFTDGVKVWRPHCLGQFNQFAIVGELTQRKILSLQVFFVTLDGTETQHSGVLTWDVRPSVRPADFGPASIPPPQPGHHAHAPGDIVASPDAAGKVLVIGEDGRCETVYLETGGMVVDEDHIFETTEGRDDYFAQHPSELHTGTLCTVHESLYQYGGSAWRDMC